MTEQIVKISRLSKSFPKQPGIIENITFDIFPGDCVCVVGPNGVGKTTFLRLISGAISADSGSILLNGKTCNSCHLLIDGDRAIFPRLSAKENIKYFLGLQGVKYNSQVSAEVTRISKKLNFEQYLNIQTQKLSKGSRQKIQLILLSLTPRLVLIMDEPTLGLDKESIEILVSILEDQKSKGKYLVLCSHDVDFCIAIGTTLLNLDSKKPVLQSLQGLENLYSIVVKSADDLRSIISDFPKIGYIIENETSIQVSSHNLIEALKLINPNSIRSVSIKGVSVNANIPNDI